jgi:hypothetical protein
MTLTKIEKEILRNPAKGLIKSNKMAWNDLKREIFDFGYQSWYYSQEEFKKPAIAAIFSLNDDAKRALIKEWKHMPRVYELKTDNEILNQYALVLVELIVTRAWKSKASNF